MTTLTEIYVATVAAKMQTEYKVQESETAYARAQQIAAGRRLEAYLAKWPLLPKLLGLKGEPTLHGGEVVICGQSSVNDLPVDTMASIGLPRNDQDHPNLQITIASRAFPAISNRMGITHNLPVADYPDRLGTLCTIWMEHYARMLAEQAAAERRYASRLAVATTIIDLAQDYQMSLGRHRAACQAWAVEQTAALWQPHVLWKIRYPVLINEFLGDQFRDHIATVVCMETPADILNGLLQSPSVTITVVSREGAVSEREIAGFLDAERIAFKAPEFEARPYHRWHHADCRGTTVNVPPHVLAEPTPPPSWAGWAGFLKEHEPKLADAGDWQFADPEWLAGMTPAGLVEHYEWRIVD